MEISLYFFKKKSNGEIDFYKIPITEETVLNEIIQKEETAISTSDIRDFFQIYSTLPSSNLYYEVNDPTDILNNFVREIVLDNSQVSSIKDFKRRKDSKDYFPFDGFVILRKETDNSFVIGIESLSDKLKLYKKGFLKLDADSYKIDSSSKTLLIPNYVTTIIKGSWNNSEVTLSQTLFRSKFYSFFEKIFGYKERWREKSLEIKNSNNNLDISDTAWNDFNKDLRNSRKFVRCFNTNEGAYQNVLAYYNIPELKDKLGFEIVEANGQQTFKINTKEEMRNFLEAFRNHIFKNPNTAEFCKAEHVEKFNNNGD